MEIINTENPNEARKQIEKFAKENKEVVVQGKSIDFNRIILENKKVNILILQHINKKDKLKQQDSGLNQVLCNLAKQNNIVLAIDFAEILGEEKKEKAKILARLNQNIKLAKKAKNKVKIINIKDKDKRDIFSFLLTLGMDTKTAKDAVS